MAKFLIVGKSFSGLKSKILERGDEYLLLQDRQATKFPQKKFKNRIVVDFEDKNQLSSVVRGLAGRVDGVVTVYEHYILPAAQIADKLGLPGLPIESAKACTDKALMRQLFSKSTEKISPEFQIINSREELLKFSKTHSYPLIIKPANLSKSLLVTKSDTPRELLKNYKFTLKNITSTYKKFAPGLTPKLLVEEFLEGPVFSVDAFIDNQGVPHVLEQVVDYQTGYDISYDDNFNYSRVLPSRLPQKKQGQIRHVAALGCRALGMKSSAAHIEIILTKSGPRVVEIGARNGGYRERMHSLANGLDLMNMTLDLALGKPVKIRSPRNEPCAVLELFPKVPGIFTGISKQDELKNLASLEYFAIKQPLGDYVGKSSEGYKACAIVILHNPDHSAFAGDLEFVNKNVFVTTQTS